ncbi:Beta-galactosidase precursor [Streptococcus cristatus]|uniref:Beta-galactosidase n=1 Tax=Streptococcus cristatus TaxID=45634 RepID=A0A3R9LR70_STRCR|nr:beta-galactosidase family protein [Streptococcus cristatus]RSJ78456.1 Beta-galactosidase precursor [Streptococcus cristatus]RSJ78559.1 Beta-galactosidase precursor [Streptococcus cristatus]RSJ84475.1 Beta-galactosidase precursor [Streptococcus cristatus]RSJ84628.1 Beta-galactosidase precursor [Streptococcus cristatus]
MKRFEIGSSFYLDGQEFKILSGAIHYFRIQPEDWYHSLYNLKALGFNTVETYVPWNMHEPKKGQFDFQGILDIEKFLQIAQDLGLYAIVRPSPFICAEWEFGGMPAWLLTEDMRIRSSDASYLQAVADYYDELLPRLVPRLLDKGGNILMMQVENEYGSYGEDKDYLRAIRQMMLDRGLDCPLFTSDGPWRATLRAGTLIEEDLFVTGNFGSKAGYNFAQMQEFFDEHGKKWPLMCMEFWDGWFNRWKEPIIKRDPEELAQAVHEVMKQGSINLYMFHGGTNFGFMNGCSARGVTDLPQVTSYDYDALLDEQGNPTPKYFAVQKMMEAYYPEYPQMKPLTKESFELRDIALSEKVSLFETLADLAQPVESLYPVKMEDLGQSYGYLLYRTEASWDADEEKIRVIDGRDRMQLFVDGKLMATQYQAEIGQDIFVAGEKKTTHRIDVLMENMGRVNYGHKFLADTQRKGIRTGVCKDLHFLLNWQQYPLSFENTENIDFSKGWQPEQPAFYAFDFEMKALKDTYLDLSGFGKGLAFVNGVNIGRFWNIGPTLSLYIPHSLLKEGHNRIIIFETEGEYEESINLVNQPTFKTIKGENL